MLLTNDPTTNEGFEREVPPAGLQKAVLVGAIDLGILPTGFKDEKTGEEKKARKLNIVWQLEERQGNGRPYLVFSRTTASWFKDPKKNKKSRLRGDWESWKGELPESYDIDGDIGQSAMLTLVHNVSPKNGETYANINGVSPLPKKDKEPVKLEYVIEDGKPKFTGEAKAANGNGDAMNEETPF
jgi:hypothetical protein